MLGRQPAEDLGAAVLRAVVDQQELKLPDLRRRYREHPADQLRHQEPFVVDRNDDAQLNPFRGSLLAHRRLLLSPDHQGRCMIALSMKLTPGRRAALGGILLALALLAVYGASIGFEFVYD